MFYDWLGLHQSFGEQIPIVSDIVQHRFCTLTGEQRGIKQDPISHEGSYSTHIQVRISGDRIYMSGNASRYNRLDNLFGFETIDEMVAVYNKILRSLNLGEYQFTKGTKIEYFQSKCGTKVIKQTDGAVIDRIDLTTNRAVGQGCVDDYIKGISTLRYRNSIPQLYSNGKTCNWKSVKGNAVLIDPSVYNKAHEIELHHLSKVGRTFGKTSPEYKYLSGVIHYCETHGVARFEQQLNSAFLRRNDLTFYGLFDESKLKPIHDDFLNIDEKLQVEAMTIEGISERLIRLGIVDTTRAANMSSLYALQWMSGQRFDITKTQVQMHRARLRKIGIDIANPCDLSRHSLVYVRKAKQVIVSVLEQPDWYIPANVNQNPQLTLVA